MWPGLAILVACLSVGLAVPLRDEFDRLDASTASMTLEGDQENQRYNRVSLLFTSDEFVLIGLTREDLFTPPGVAAVESLRAACEQVEGVASALSLTNVALLRSHEKQTSLFQALIQQKRLGDAGISFEKAREELTQHELYAGNLVSKDAKTAGIVVTLARTPEQVDVTNRWLDLNETRLEAERADSARSTAETAAQLAQAQAAVERMLPEWTAMEDARKASRRQVIEEVRGLVEERAAAGADVGLSGVPALAVEMVEAIGRGEGLPVDLGNRAIYYVGPVDAVGDEVIGPAGPTTATRISAPKRCSWRAGPTPRARRFTPRTCWRGRSIATATPTPRGR